MEQQDKQPPVYQDSDSDLRKQIAALTRQNSDSDLRKQIADLTRQNAELTARIPDGQGMTVPQDIKVSTIHHQNDPKTKEAIAPTIRTDFGFDPHQKFRGRQP